MRVRASLPARTTCSLFQHYVYVSTAGILYDTFQHGLCTIWGYVLAGWRCVGAYGGGGFEYTLVYLLVKEQHTHTQRERERERERERRSWRTGASA